MVVEYRSREVSVAKSGGLNHDTRFNCWLEKNIKMCQYVGCFPYKALLNDNTKQPEVLMYLCKITEK